MVNIDSIIGVIMKHNSRIAFEKIQVYSVVFISLQPFKNSPERYPFYWNENVEVRMHHRDVRVVPICRSSALLLLHFVMMCADHFEILNWSLSSIDLSEFLEFFKLFTVHPTSRKSRRMTRLSLPKLVTMISVCQSLNLNQGVDNRCDTIS